MMLVQLLSKAQAEQFLAKHTAGMGKEATTRETRLFAKYMWMVVHLVLLSRWDVLEACVVIMQRDHKADGHRIDNNTIKNIASIIGTFLAGILSEVKEIREKTQKGNQPKTGTVAMKLLSKETNALCGGGEGRIELTSAAKLPTLVALTTLHEKLEAADEYVVKMGKLLVADGFSAAPIDQLAEMVLNLAKIAIALYGHKMGGDPEKPLTSLAASSSTALVVSTPEKALQTLTMPDSLKLGDLAAQLGLAEFSQLGGAPFVLTPVGLPIGAGCTPERAPSGLGVLASVLYSAQQQQHEQQHKMLDVLTKLGEQAGANQDQTMRSLNGAFDLSKETNDVAKETLHVAKNNGDKLDVQSGQLVTLQEEARETKVIAAAASAKVSSLEEAAEAAEAQAIQERVAQLAQQKAMRITAAAKEKADKLALAADIKAVVTGAAATSTAQIEAAVSGLGAALKMDTEEAGQAVVGDIQQLLATGALKQDARLVEHFAEAAPACSATRSSRRRARSSPAPSRRSRRRRRPSWRPPSRRRRR